MDLCEFEASLVYRVRTVKVTQRNSVKKPKPQTNKQTNKQKNTKPTNKATKHLEGHLENKKKCYLLA